LPSTIPHTSVYLSENYPKKNTFYLPAKTKEGVFALELAQGIAKAKRLILAKIPLFYTF